MKAKVRKVRGRPKRFCDPNCCDHCLYVGEGDFLCDCHPRGEYVVVMSDWERTEFFLHCMKRKGDNER